jgi:hypothetical protein
MKLNVNLIAHKKFWEAGTEIPDHLVPDWARIKYRCGDVEAAEIRQRREELRAEARERREKMEAKRAEKRAAKQSVRNL